MPVEEWENHPDYQITRPQYDKIAGISEHSYIMNKKISNYDWETWESRIDFDFYIKTAKARIKGWLE